MDASSLDQLTDLTDPFFPSLETFDGFSDLFSFNNLNEPNLNVEQAISNQITQNPLQKTDENCTNQLDNLETFLLNDQLNLLDQPQSNNITNTFYSNSMSNSPEILYESATSEQTTESFSNSPVSVVFSEIEKDGLKITKELVFNFEEQCRNFVDFNEDIINPEKMEVIVDTNTCLDLNEFSDEEDNDSDSFKMPIEKFKLTEEEKSVFIKEGYKLPTHMPLTKSEEKLLKLVRRKIRNKKSAHNSRERKKNYVNGLEKRVEYYTKINEELLRENKLLKSQNNQMIKKMQNMQQFVNDLFKKNKKSSTALLFVSFLLTFCIYPYSDSVSDESNVYQSKFQVIPFKGYSRTLLSTDSNYTSVSGESILSEQSTFERLFNFYKERYDL